LFLYSVMDPEDQDQQKSLSKLEEQVKQWEEVQRADDFWGKGDLEDSRAKLYVLAAGFHAHCPSASEGGKVKQVVDLIHFQAMEEEACPPCHCNALCICLC